MATRRVSVSGLVLLLVVGVVATLEAQPVGPRITPRDQLTVAVFGVAQLSGKFAVTADGTINYPLLGLVRVADLTTSAVEAELGKRLTEGGFFTSAPQITVSLEQTPNKRVTVTGSVRSAGVILYAGELTVLDALVRAGGLAADASDEALVVRSSPAEESPASVDGTTGEAHPTLISVNLRELQSGNVASHNVALQDGDMIIIQRAQSIYVSGQVRSPGAVRAETGATVLQVLTLAGGLTERGTTRGLRIIRNKEEIKDVGLETVVNAGDTIIVRASPW